jgi:hypothetical protein
MLLMGKLTISMAIFNRFFYDPWVEKSLGSGLAHHLFPQSQKRMEWYNTLVTRKTVGPPNSR